jgi:NAD(P)-dependent dehydrogenase (short-subunit alcohol dehydrogenase family)
MDPEDLEYDLLSGALIALCTVGVGAALWKRSMKEPRPMKDLIGLQYIVTGANSGIGLATARMLANRGGHVILGVRNIPGGEDVKKEILKEGVVHASQIEVHQLNLCSFKSIENFVNSLQSKSKKLKLHCLINNAGAILPEYQKIHGIESSMLTNYIAPLYLTSLLQSNLETTAITSGIPSRIINVSSRLEKNAKISDNQIRDMNRSLNSNTDEQYNHWTAYADSKHCQLLATYGTASLLTKEGKSTNLTVHAVTPGMVHTNLSRNMMSSFLSYLAWPIQRLILRTPEQGAAPVVYAATDPVPGKETGKYYQATSNGVIVEERSSERTYNLNLQKELLSSSIKLIEKGKLIEEGTTKKLYTKKK